MPSDSAGRLSEVDFSRCWSAPSRPAETVARRRVQLFALRMPPPSGGVNPNTTCGLGGPMLSLVTENRPVAIVGAGMAGVTAASALRRLGVPIRLYEAGPRIAGLAMSYQDPEGFTHDFGAHFITNRLADAVGIGADC